MSARLSRKILAGLAMAPLLLLGTPTAFASEPWDTIESDTGISDVVAFVGTGTTAPGIPLQGCAVQTSHTFTALVTVQAGDDGVGASGSLSFSGDSDGYCETLNSGQGSGTLSGSVSGTVSYSRTGNVVTVSGTGLAVSGSTERHDITLAVCVKIPVVSNPIQSYGLVCVAILASEG
jgi:hypothetical protein